ncbi:MAG: serine/threonine-protein kinase [Caldilineaceae bacterium]|nr:serine/threonine-protein kinase [Caldilineaceae bacterium]
MTVPPPSPQPPDPSDADARAARHAADDAAADPDESDLGGQERLARGNQATAHLSGQHISHFHVQERLGTGAMSSVYRAVNTETGALVALKVLMPGADPVARSRFRQEARTAMQLRHPHIVRTHEVGELPDRGISYIAMELVQGESLSELLERRQRLSAADACRILEPIARALDYAHGQGIVHRDVKPSNILLQRVAPGTPNAVTSPLFDEPMIPLLSDFGIARALDAPELTSAGRTVGTPAYMAPEQCEGAWEIDGRADIYALGAVYYRCLVGRPPFTGTTTQILYAHVYSPLMLPDDVMAALPAQAVETLRASLAKAPEQRYQTAAVMADALATTAALLDAGDAAPAPGDATMTMTSLPATDRTSSATMLVPAPATQSATALPATAAPALAPRRRRRVIQPVALAVSVVASIGLLAIIVVVALQLLRGNGSAADLPPVEATARAVATADSAGGAPDGPAEDAAVTPGAPGNDAQDEDLSAPIPVFDIESVWRDAQFFYAERDWANALEALTLILRRDIDFNNRFFRNEGTLSQLYVDLLRDNPDAPFWDEHADYFDEPQFNRMLADIFVGLALGENALNRPNQAKGFFDEALTIAPDAPMVQELADATQALIDSTLTTRPERRADLQQLHIQFATTLADEERFCDAADQLQAAVGLQPDTAVSEDLIAYQDECAQEIATEAGRVELGTLEGTFIYSTNVDNRYRIYASLAADPTGATLLIENGSQPSVSPVASRIAFYNTQADDLGLSAFDVGIGLRPTDRVLRYTGFAEDGLDSPAGWSPNGDRLVFSSRREGDRRDRVYVVNADGSRNADTLAFGKDPAWHPSADTIVYNGVDLSGNRPGLWLMRSDGTNTRPLTDVATDIRPTWTPDGESVVFMSSARDGNWEVYRVDLGDGAVTRLTDDPAQDGIPVVSPDGRNVAFFSDRGGSWALWVVSINGGDAQRILTPEGSLERWLEHGLDWVD